MSCARTYRFRLAILYHIEVLPSRLSSDWAGWCARTFLINRAKPAGDVGYCHIASFRCDAAVRSLSDRSGHPALYEFTP
jgi:hypothetical protein